jgi:orotate phosphoribosyltransferase
MFRNQDGWIAEFVNRGAYWEHDGNPHRPHALLTSGNHSNGFFNSGIVVSDDDLLVEAVSDLVELIEGKSVHCRYADVIAGPQTGATKLAEFIGRRKDRPWVSPAKTREGPMLLSPEDRLIVAGKRSLLCEDVITTGGSIKRTASPIIDADGRVLPYVVALVNRSGLAEADGRQIVALIEHNLSIWTPEECPLCQQGSKAIRPKEKDPCDNWALLNATYD